MGELQSSPSLFQPRLGRQGDTEGEASGLGPKVARVLTGGLLLLGSLSFL